MMYLVPKKQLDHLIDSTVGRVDITTTLLKPFTREDITIGMLESLEKKGAEMPPTLSDAQIEQEAFVACVNVYLESLQ